MKITAMTNGPLVLEGRCTLRDENGKPYAHAGKLVLCRCGGSARRPFCDGTHTRNGFAAPPQPSADPELPPPQEPALDAWESEGGAARPQLSPRNSADARAHLHLHRLLRSGG